MSNLASLDLIDLRAAPMVSALLQEASAEPVADAAGQLALANCRKALTEALGLLTLWIEVNCGRGFSAEHFAKVEELRALGGLS